MNISDEEFASAISAMQHTSESAPEERAADIEKDELRHELERLSRLEPIDYERQRTAVAQRFNLRRSVLDKLVDTLKTSGAPASEGKGSSLDLRPPLPWHQQVDGDALVRSMVTWIPRHVVLPPAAAIAVTLWILFTYMLDSFSHSPRLAITSPTPRCGKTTLLELIARACLKPLTTSNISPAAVFRTIEACGPTLLIDEADSFLKDNEELRGVLNSGHSRTAAFVIRTVGDDHEPRKFSTWCALVVALIGKLAATLQDRSIEVALKRKTPSETIQRLGPDANRELEVWARKAARWTADNIKAVAAVTPAIPAGLDNRAEDNWRPLLAIAAVAGGQWPALASQAAIVLNRTREESSIGVLLLSDLRTLFTVHNTDHLHSEFIVKELGAIESRPWPEYRRGRPITVKQLAALLKPFGISPATVGEKNKEAKGYRLKWFTEAFDRYLSPPTPVSGVEASNSFSPSDLDDFFDPSIDQGFDKPKSTFRDTVAATSTVQQEENDSFTDREEI